MSAITAPQLAVIDVKPGAAMESQSGLQMLRPRIFGAWRAPVGGARTAAIVMHPASNFMGHYLVEPLAARGLCCMGLNSRYAGNDAVLLMERVIQDLGAGVKHLRAAGYERVVLVGNSGGAGLAAFYQAEAESLTVDTLVDGDPAHLVPDDLPPVDAIVLCAAHLGRSRLLLEWIDPSVTDEHDPLSVDPSLDLYDARHAVPYPSDFLARFAAGQRARRDRIEAWVLARLRTLRATPGAPRDQTFVVHRTHADPRCVDRSLAAHHPAPRPRVRPVEVDPVAPVVLVPA